MSCSRSMPLPLASMRRSARAMPEDRLVELMTDLFGPLALLPQIVDSISLWKRYYWFTLGSWPLGLFHSKGLPLQISILSIE
jgi:hypothetical protein